MTEGNEKKPSDVVVRSVGRRFYRRKSSLVLMVLLVVLLAGGGVWYWAQYRQGSGSSGAKDQHSGQSLADEVQKKYGHGDYEGAINLIKSQKNSNDTETQLLLAAAYTNKGDHKASLAIYEQLEKENKLIETTTAAAADVAEHTGEWQKAIDFYKKAKDRAPAEATDQRAVYDYKIAELGKKL